MRRRLCRPIFDRPLADISFGKVLMRLFRVSRRFNVEIQPQLVLLQKTLLNVEGPGSPTGPYLDLWATAQPFLENWMRDQIARRHRETPDRTGAYLSSGLPQLPRLIHQALERRAEAAGTDIIQARSLWTNVWLAIIAFCLLAILGTLWIPLLLE